MNPPQAKRQDRNLSSLLVYITETTPHWLLHLGHQSIRPGGIRQIDTIGKIKMKLVSKLGRGNEHQVFH